MSNPELKPWPFCGGAARARQLFDMHWVYCTECSVNTCNNRTKSDAIAAWNRRVEVKS